MAVTIRWSVPKDAGWTFSRIYRASSKNGSYSLITSIAIGTYSYADSTGSSSYWYKISYYDGVNESSLSDAIQGGTNSTYCSLSLFRNICNFTTNEISDADVIAMMPIVSRMISRKLYKKIKLERLEGNIDGSNTIFYSGKKPLGDMDMNGEVNENDVLIYYATYDANNRINYGSSQTISSVDARGGRITMSTAPTSTTAKAGVYGTYGWTVEDINYDDVIFCATYLLAHYASLKIKGETPNFSAIETPYLRGNVAGSIGLPYDPWRYPYWRSAMQILNALLGNGSDGMGFSNVKAKGIEY